jgi:hypothetical protein
VTQASGTPYWPASTTPDTAVHSGNPDAGLHGLSQQQVNALRNELIQITVQTVYQALTGIFPLGASAFGLLASWAGVVPLVNPVTNQLPTGVIPDTPLVLGSAQALSQQAIAKPGYLAVDASADAVFPIANIQGTTPTVVSVSAGASVIGFIPTPDNGKKSSIIWLGQNTSGITGFFINLYKLNTSTGALTLVQGSTNIVSSVSNTLAWNYYNLTAPTTTSVSDVYAVEVVVTGSGTYQIAGMPNHWLPANASVYPRQMGATRAPIAVTYDATGAGYTASPNASTASGSWSHTAAAGATVIVSVATQQNSSTPTTTATYGGVAMTSLGISVNPTAGNTSVQLFGLQNVAGGPKTVAVSLNAGSNTVQNFAGQSASYTGVGGLQTAVTNGGTSGSLSSGSVPSALQNMVVCAFVAGAGSAFSMTSYSGTQRASQSVNSGGNYLVTALGDTPGTSSSSITVTASDGGAWWASVAVDLIPTLEPAPTTPAFTYSGNVPWFGLGGFLFAGPLTTQYNTAGSHTYTIPTWLKWGDKIDIAALGAGAGGLSSAAWLAGYGGLAGSWMPQTLVYGVDIPATTTSLTVTVGAGGSGSGGSGGNSTITGTGVTTITANGGTGNTGSANAGPGPGNQALNGITYTGGGAQNTQGGNGIAPGGGGAGGFPYGPGGAGADGSVWLVAYQAGTAP